MTDDPVNKVRLSDSRRVFIVDECVICGQEHGHGARDPAVARGELSHRVSHCQPRDADEDAPGGYYLKLADDAERPDRWVSWAMEVSA